MFFRPKAGERDKEHLHMYVSMSQLPMCEESVRHSVLCLYEGEV